MRDLWAVLRLNWRGSCHNAPNHYMQTCSFGAGNHFNALEKNMVIDDYKSRTSVAILKRLRKALGPKALTNMEVQFK